MAISWDQSSIARTYYETMRGSFAAYYRPEGSVEPDPDPVRQQKAAMVKTVTVEFEELDPLKGETPSLGQLFKIEIELLSLIPETALRERFWTIENRFNRVVPKGMADAFISSIGGALPAAADGEVLLQRARTLLGVIHSNYEVNFKRELLIRRLMTFVSAIAFVLIAVSALTASVVVPLVGQRALLLIAIVGMAGAIISTIQRLQKATSRDAMVDDGIFELISLRIGWLSILMSFGIGGVSALFIYALISAGLLDTLVPQLAGSPTNQNVLPEVCELGKTCAHWADQTYQALGLHSRADLFKLTVYAFVAGFAERFVPDTINKLAKDAFPPTTSTTG